MTEPNRIEIDEKLRQDSAICKRGVETDFWRLVKKMGADLQKDAMHRLVLADPSDVSAIAQCQQVVKVVDEFIAVVEGTAALT